MGPLRGRVERATRALKPPVSHKSQSFWVTIFPSNYMLQSKLGCLLRHFSISFSNKVEKDQRLNLLQNLTRFEGSMLNMRSVTPLWFFQYKSCYMCRYEQKWGEKDLTGIFSFPSRFRWYTNGGGWSFCYYLKNDFCTVIFPLILNII